MTDDSRPDDIPGASEERLEELANRRPQSNTLDAASADLSTDERPIELMTNAEVSGDADDSETLPSTYSPSHAAVDSLDPDASGRGEGVGQLKEVEGLSQGRIVFNRFIRHRGAVFGVVVFALVFLLAFSAMGVGSIHGWWPHHDANFQFDVDPVKQGAPTRAFPFGQDMVGRDNFAQVMKGIQTSILVMAIMSIVALAVGVTVGSLSGYYRGRLDNVLMRFTDLIITLPLIVVGSVLGRLITTLPNKYNWPAGITDAIKNFMPLELAVALGLVVWPGLARLTRSEFLRLREYEFVDSARVAGASDRRIIFKHILPNALGVIIVNVTLLMSASVVLESALSFLGFGISFPSISLGNLISTNQAAFNTRPWLFWWPGLFIVLLALSVNFIGDGLRDAFDPRTRRVPSQRVMDRAARQDQPASEHAMASAGTRALPPTEEHHQ